MTADQLKDLVFERFLRDGDWPAFRDLEADLIDHAPLQELIEADDDSEVNFEYPITDESRVLLTLRGIAASEGGDPWIRRYLAAARFAGERYLEDRGEAHFTNEDLESALSMEPEDARTLGRILWDLAGPLTRGGGRSIDDESFQFSVSPAAMHFRNVNTLDEYFAVFERIEELRQKERALVGEPYWGATGPQVSDAFEPSPSLLEQFHPIVSKAADRFLTMGANAEAVRISLQMFEAYVQELTGEDGLSGKDLMARAFRSGQPMIKLNERTNRQDQNEQEGFMFLAMGAMVALRNRYSHGIPISLSWESTLEQLSIVSFLFRKIEDVTGKKAVAMGIAGVLNE